MRIAFLALSACGRIGFSTGEELDVTDALSDATDEPGLIAWYQMEDDPADGRLEDSAGTNQPALCAPGLTCGSTTPGRVGQGVLLDGSEHFFRTASDPSFVTPDGFTVAFWARLDSAAFTQAYTVTKRYSAIHNSWAVYLDDLGNTIYETVHDPGPTGDYEVISPAPSIGTWFHYAVTWDNTTKRGYRDGVKLVDFAVADLAFDDSDILIGADEDNGSVYAFWPGAIDEIRIYNRKLSDFEIQQLSQL